MRWLLCLLCFSERAAALSANPPPRRSRRSFLSSSAAAVVVVSSSATNLPVIAAPVVPQQQGQATREFLTGLAGGAAQRIAKDIVLHPIDTVKTRLQRAGNSREISRRLLADPYAGVAGPLVVGVPAGALFFGVKDALSSLGGDTILNEALVVSAANVPYWAVRSPAELVKVRQQLDNTGLNGFELAQTIAKQDGVGGLYRGALESYVYATPTDLVKFVAYRQLKRTFPAPKDKKIVTKAVLGSFASATAQLATTPLDVVRTRAMDDDKDDKLNILSRAAAIAREEGAGALFAGLTPRLLRAFVSGALQFGSYELTKKSLSSS